MALTSKHIFVAGRVQGVCFRAFVRDQARQAGINGWAKNLNDGRVEIILSGEKAAIAVVENALHQGPTLSSVEYISSEFQDFDAIAGFTIA